MAGLLVVVLAALVVAAPASAAKPKSGFWFTDQVDLNDDSNHSSAQFEVAKNRKKLTKVTIFWRCGDSREYHEFRNSPIPFFVDKKKRFKVRGATEPPAGESATDFTLKGKFTSRKTAKYSMKLDGCGPKTKGQISWFFVEK